MLEVTDKWDCYVIKSVKRRHFPPCNNGQRSLHALNVVSGNKKDQATSRSLSEEETTEFISHLS